MEKSEGGAVAAAAPGKPVKRFMRKRMFALATTLALAGGSALCVWGCSSAQVPETEAEKEIVAIENTEEYWAQYMPKVEVLPDGREVQRTPFGAKPNTDPYHQYVNFYNDDWELYNTFILNGDERGCGSCHADMEETLEAINHTVDYIGHLPGNRLTYSHTSSCMSCHDPLIGGRSITSFAHAHMNFPAFQEMGGNCNSCHYTTADGEYVLWDDVKYDVFEGITSVAAEDAGMSVDWNQTEVLAVEDMFTERQAGHGFSNELVARGDDTLDNYMITVSGDVDNPFEMSLQDMIDTFGTETQIMTNQCVLNGGGEDLIYNAEVTGIPISKIAEYAQIRSNVNAVDAIGCDGYHIPSYLDIAPNAMLVVEMNGEPLNADQGYPVAMWFGSGIPGGSITRFVSEINFHEASEDNDHWFAYGGVYWSTEYVCPNIGVVSDPSGIIKEAGSVHLGGYASAFTEPVTKMSFSLDYGETWTEVPIEGMNPQQWVYWNLDMNLDPGAYVLTMRATSVMADGTEHSSAYPPQFLFNVR